MLTENGQILLKEPYRATKINRQLSKCRILLPGFNSAHGNLQLSFIHFGPGRYEAGSGAKPHQHEMLQVQYVVCGNFLFAIGQTSYPMHSGDGLIIPPGCIHNWQCYQTGVLVGLQMHGMVNRREPTQSIPAYSFCGDNIAEEFGRLMRFVLFEENPWQVEKTAFLLGSWLTEVLTAICPDEQKDNHNAETHDEIMYRRIYDFLESNYKLPISLDDIGMEVGCSPRHLNRIFQQRSNESVYQALIRIRLDRARHILVNHSTPSVKATAYECGFNHPAYFTAKYRERFGETPTTTIKNWCKFF